MCSGYPKTANGVLTSHTCLIKKLKNLFDECITLCPSYEQFRLVRISTLVDVFDEGSGLK